ncbi:MAG: RNA polymerase sigma factor [Myxococcota bacterium]|nr:RNA polymerase sigma factor [Myxococcota bacterium]
MLSLILMAVRKRTRGDHREMSDEELMERYRDGDIDAFERLLNRHEHKMFGFLHRKIGDRQKAHDLLQDVFLRVIRSAPQYRRKSRFTTWLYTIARNLVVDELRRMSHRRHRSLNAPLTPGDRTGLEDKLPGRSADGFMTTDGAQIKARINDALNQLSEAQREVFIMRELMNLSFKEIGEVIGISENTVKSRMRYALDNLRLALADYAQELPVDVNPVPKRSRV